MPGRDVYNSLRRVNSFPLDDSTVFENEASLDNYLSSTSPTRGVNIYDGQIVYVKSGENSNQVYLYVLKKNKQNNLPWNPRRSTNARNSSQSPMLLRSPTTRIQRIPKPSNKKCQSNYYCSRC